VKWTGSTGRRGLHEAVQPNTGDSRNRARHHCTGDIPALLLSSPHATGALLPNNPSAIGRRRPTLRGTRWGLEPLGIYDGDLLLGLESSNARKRCSISTNLTPHFAHRPHVTGGNDSLSRPRLLLLPHGQPCSSPLRESVDTKAFLTFRSRGKTDDSRCCRRGKACLHPAGSQSSWSG
jgi:hypothetical protein